MPTLLVSLVPNDNAKGIKEVITVITETKALSPHGKNVSVCPPAKMTVWDVAKKKWQLVNAFVSAAWWRRGACGAVRERTSNLP